jgi:hypothetical protein
VSPEKQERARIRKLRPGAANLLVERRNATEKMWPGSRKPLIEFPYNPLLYVHLLTLFFSAVFFHTIQVAFHPKIVLSGKMQLQFLAASLLQKRHLNQLRLP